MDGVKLSEGEWCLTIWILMGAAFIFPLTPFIAIIVAHLKRRSARSELLWTHAGYAIWTFWLSMLIWLVVVALIIGAIWAGFTYRGQSVLTDNIASIWVVVIALVMAALNVIWFFVAPYVVA